MSAGLIQKKYGQGQVVESRCTHLCKKITPHNIGRKGSITTEVTHRGKKYLENYKQKFDCAVGLDYVRFISPCLLGCDADPLGVFGHVSAGAGGMDTGASCAGVGGDI